MVLPTHIATASSGASNPIPAPLPTHAGWEDILNADVRRMVLRRADRRVEYESAGWRPLPPELVPASNLALYNATLEANHQPPETGPQTFDVDTVRRLFFAREEHGILGPLTVRFNDVVDREWWGFYDEGEGENGTLALDPDIICPALDCDMEWTCITRIRLVPHLQNSAVPGHYEPPPPWRYELVRDGAHGHQHMVITPPPDLYAFYLDALEKLQVTRDLVEKLHMRHAVVNGVDEFSVYTSNLRTSHAKANLYITSRARPPAAPVLHK